MEEKCFAFFNVIDFINQKIYGRSKPLPYEQKQMWYCMGQFALFFYVLIYFKCRGGYQSPVNYVQAYGRIISSPTSIKNWNLVCTNFKHLIRKPRLRGLDLSVSVPSRGRLAPCALTFKSKVFGSLRDRGSAHRVCINLVYFILRWNLYYKPSPAEKGDHGRGGWGERQLHILLGNA